MFPFGGAPEIHSAMSLTKSALKLEVGLQWLMNCVILLVSLSFLILQPSNHDFLKLAAKLGIMGNSCDVGITYHTYLGGAERE